MFLSAISRKGVVNQPLKYKQNLRKFLEKPHPTLEQLTLENGAIIFEQATFFTVFFTN